MNIGEFLTFHFKRFVKRQQQKKRRSQAAIKGWDTRRAREAVKWAQCVVEEKEG